jgi:hypothetical protein
MADDRKYYGYSGAKQNPDGTWVCGSAIRVQKKILMVHGYAVELTVRLNKILIVHGCVDNHLTSAGNRTVKSRANSACYCCGS